MKMKKYLLSLLAVAVAGGLASCSKNVQPDGQEDGAKGELVAKITFEGVADNKAALSTAVPVTSWTNIRQLQVILYDASNVVKYSDIVTPNPGQTTFTWADVPAGTYTLAMVANVKSSTDAVTTSLDGGATVAEWTKFNVRSKSVASQLTIAHKASSFPAGVAGDYAGKTAFAEPAEIFMGYQASVTVSNGTTTVVPGSVALKREVALMRVRLRQNDRTDADNTNVNFNGADASIMIHRLPESMKVAQGNDGGVGSTSAENNILVAASGTSTFKTGNPTTGYAPAIIVDADYTMWRDIVVMPNDAGRSNTAANILAVADRQYFVVVSGHAPQGHVLADGTTVSSASGATVYWSGLVREAFVPNIIREVNLNLRSGGSTDVPPAPTQEGGLTITVSAPAAWNSNIERTDIEL